MPDGQACPLVVIMDDQSVKTTERGGARGFDAHKRRNRQRVEGENSEQERKANQTVPESCVVHREVRH